MERDILRRTHNVFSSLKDETGNKYEDRDTSVSFVDENTLKYQSVIKKMDVKKASKVGSGDEEASEEASEEGSEDGEELKQQSNIITANIKHIGKGIVVQSYDISDDEDEEDESGSDISENKVMMTYNENVHNPNKKIVYTVDKNIDVDDI